MMLLHNAWILLISCMGGLVIWLVAWMCIVSYERARDYWKVIRTNNSTEAHNE